MLRCKDRKIKCNREGAKVAKNKREEIFFMHFLRVFLRVLRAFAVAFDLNSLPDLNLVLGVHIRLMPDRREIERHEKAHPDQKN